MNKIVINGFPHSGTSILRRVIGSQEGVLEILRETYAPGIVDGSYQHLVWKFTGLPIHEYPGCKRIMIIKNPWDIFGSIRLRFGEKWKDIHHHQVKDYLQYATAWKEAHSRLDILPVKYERLMSSRQDLIDCMKWAGISRPSLDKVLQAPDWEDPPPRAKHMEFRTWQNKQPLQDMTGGSSLACDGWVARDLEHYEIIKQIGYEREKL